MTKLSDSLKKMLTGLAHQDAGEFMTMHDKMRVLGQGSETRNKPSTPLSSVSNMLATQRIALISDARGLDAPLSYAIDACQRQEATIDLLIHGTTDVENLSNIEKRIKEAGIICHRIQLGTRPVDGVIEYISNHPGLIFMVSMPDDGVAKLLMEEVIPKQGAGINVPLVLIDDPASEYPTERCA